MKKIITIKNLPVECVVGCWDWERKQTQVIEADLSLYLRDAGVVSSLTQTWDYSVVAKNIEFILQSGQFLLLENAVDFLARFFLLPHFSNQPQMFVQKVFVQITKFRVLTEKALAVVALEYDANDVSFSKKKESWGSCEFIQTNNELELQRLTILPGHCLTQESSYASSHFQLLTHQLTLSCENKKTDLQQNQIFQVLAHQSYQLINATDFPQSVLLMKVLA